VPKVDLPTGVKIHYTEIGEGPELVMIHGLTGNLAVWHLKIVPLLWDRFHILTYDLRGHGYSSMPESGYTVDQMCADLLALLDELKIKRPFLVGHSFGADIALYFAHRHPDRVSDVVAVEAALPAMIFARASNDWEGWDYWSEVLERSGFPVPADRRTDVDFLLRASLEVPKKWGPLAGLPRNSKAILRLIETTSIAEDSQEVGSLTLESVGDIVTPVHLIYSDGSAFLGTERYLAEHLPNVESILLPATEWGHFGPLEQPEMVAEAILSCLDPSETAP
jgi:pimeloyl-ACP methyl ester carboxylesterase